MTVHFEMASVTFNRCPSLQNHFRRTRLPVRALNEPSTSSNYPKSTIDLKPWIASGIPLSTLFAAESAMAINRELGILEGTSLALVHPFVMLILFGSTLYAGWLGWQWKRLREIGIEIKDLKEQLPKADAEGNVPPSPLSSQIASLEEVIE